MRLELGAQAFGKLLNIAGPQFPHLQNGIDSAYLYVKLNKIIMNVEAPGIVHFNSLSKSVYECLRARL